MLVENARPTLQKIKEYFIKIRKSSVFLPVIILGLSIVFFVWTTATRPVDTPSPVKERVWIVEAITAQPRSHAPTMVLYGTIETPDLMKAAAPNKGRVQTVLVREGDRVSAGQLLLALDERDFRFRLLQTEARVKELSAEIENEQIRFKNDQKGLGYESNLLKLSKAAVSRIKKLKIKNLVSETAVDEAQENLEKQKLTVNKRRLSLNGYQSRLLILDARRQGVLADRDLARLDLERSAIKSPYEGYVAKIDVSEGDQVVANQLLLTLYPTHSLEVKAMIPAPYRAEIQSAIAEQLPLEATAEIGKTELFLDLNRVSGQADTRGINAIFAFKEIDDSIRIGGLIEIKLHRPARANSVVIPPEALYGRNRIYKINDNRLSSLKVEVVGEYRDPHHGSGVLISSPSLEAGDLILTSYLPNAVDGMQVEFRNLTTQTPSKVGGLE